MYSARFVCSAGCDVSYALDEIVYRCGKCNALLEVAHDRAALSSKSADQWKQLFRERRATPSLTDARDASGVWSKREWVMPWVRAENVVTLGEGHSPLQHVPSYGRAFGVENVYLKLCGNSHTGSFKDLGMTVLVSAVNQMIRDGKPIAAIVCASTGDTSAALAAYAACANIRTAVLLPRGKVTTAQLVQPLASGAFVAELDTDFDGCMAIVQKLAEESGIYLANSMNSLRIEGQKTVGIEVSEQMGWDLPDWFVIPGGNLGNVAALAAGLDLLHALGITQKRPRICVAQARAANPLYQAFVNGFDKFASMTAQPTEASAIRIGNPVSIQRAIKALQRYDGVVEDASEAELAESCTRADRAGAYTCPHTGVALAAFEKLARKGVIKKTDRVVVVSTASGLKFTDFKVRYHESKIDSVKSESPNRPVALPNDYAAVRDAIIGAHA